MVERQERPTLESFDISKKGGFLPEVPPLDALPAPVFDKWNQVFFNLSDLIRKRELRAKVDSLPEFSIDDLHTSKQWRAALVLLSGVFQGYMWQDGEGGLPSKMPAIISCPFSQVSRKIGTPLVGTYASMVLYNWRLKDPCGKIEMENLEAIVNHTGTRDESGFFMIHVVIEVEAAPAIEGIWNGLCAMDNKDSTQLKECLTNIDCALKAMTTVLKCMSDSCDPKNFFVDIRPYLGGLEGLELEGFKQGIVCEGVDSEPKKYRGASAAQSTPLQAIDCFLGVQHSGEPSQILEEMRSYMPKTHRQFIEYLSKQVSVHDYVTHNNASDLIEKFNATIGALASFRTQHIQTVTRFIINQKQEIRTPNPSREDTGTGGVKKFMDFLKEIRDNTEKTKF